MVIKEKSKDIIRIILMFGRRSAQNIKIIRIISPRRSFASKADYFDVLCALLEVLQCAVLTFHNITYCSVLICMGVLKISMNVILRLSSLKSFTTDCKLYSNISKRFSELV